VKLVERIGLLKVPYKLGKSPRLSARSKLFRITLEAHHHLHSCSTAGFDKAQEAKKSANGSVTLSSEVPGFFEKLGSRESCFHRVYAHLALYLFRPVNGSLTLHLNRPQSKFVELMDHRLQQGSRHHLLMINSAPLSRFFLSQVKVD
jgi:hypothetical protein